MSIGMVEKQVLYDNPSAPIVKFSYEFDEDMIDDQPPSYFTLEHSFKAFSLEDLVKSFDNTINSCFSEQQIIESPNIPHTDLVVRSKTWSNLIDHLRTSLRHDLKLPQIAKSSINSIDEDEFLPIDDVNEEELCEQLAMHSFNHEPFLTAEQVLSEIDFMLQDMTPDSGYHDDLQASCLPYDLKKQSICSLNELIEELNRSIKDLSSILVQELDCRDELDYEKETKNTFISLLFNIQNKRQYYQNEKRHSRIGNINSIESGMYLTASIPFDRQHRTYLSLEYLQNLNKILHAMDENSSQVPTLLTNYILEVLCPCY